MARSRTIGRTRRRHWTWLQRGMLGSRRWRADCRCGWVGIERRYRYRAVADGLEHASGRNHGRETA